MSNTTKTAVGNVSATGVRTMGQMLSALILGIVIIYGAGFLNMGLAHNAAHDTRHAQGFPCH